MSGHRASTALVLGLVIGLPVVTLVATGYQMLGTGGDGPIRPTAVNAPPPAAAAGGQAGQQAGPAGQAGQGQAAQGGQPGPPAGQPPGGQSAAAVAPPRPAEPVPGRSALDFSTPKLAWEASLRNADPNRGRELAAAGRPQAGVQACVGCHGQQGVAAPEGNFPNLAGLRADYIAKQLTDYRTGSRNHALMGMIAKALTDEEIGQLARYYGSLPAPAVQAAAGPDAARTLDVHGENARALPACANCHGLQGSGEGPLLPRLAGQPKSYFIDQMNAFRSGQRHNDDVGVMRAFAQRLTPQDIEALAGYYAGAQAAAGK